MECDSETRLRRLSWRACSLVAPIERVSQITINIYIDYRILFTCIKCQSPQNQSPPYRSVETSRRFGTIRMVQSSHGIVINYVGT